MAWLYQCFSIFQPGYCEDLIAKGNSGISPESWSWSWECPAVKDACRRRCAVLDPWLRFSGCLTSSYTRIRTHLDRSHSKVVGSPPSLLVPQEKGPDGPFSCGADGEIRDFQPLAIIGLQLVEKISAPKYASFSSTGCKCVVYDLVSFWCITRVEDCFRGITQYSSSAKNSVYSASLGKARS